MKNSVSNAREWSILTTVIRRHLKAWKNASFVFTSPHYSLDHGLHEPAEGEDDVERSVRQADPAASSTGLILCIWSKHCMYLRFHFECIMECEISLYPLICNIWIRNISTLTWYYLMISMIPCISNCMYYLFNYLLYRLLIQLLIVKITDIQDDS